MVGQDADGEVSGVDDQQPANAAVSSSLEVPGRDLGTRRPVKSYDALLQENEVLREKLRQQTEMTQTIGELFTSEVLNVLRRRNVIPDGLTPSEHPIWQVVGTCISALQCKLEDAQEWRERHCREAEQNGKQAQEFWRQLQAVSELAKSLGWDFQARNANLVGCLKQTIDQLRKGNKQGES